MNYQYLEDFTIFPFIETESTKRKKILKKKKLQVPMHPKKLIFIIYCTAKSCYRNVPKFWDRQVWANSADPDQTAHQEQSDQGLHCLQFPLHLLEALL